MSSRLDLTGSEHGSCPFMTTSFPVQSSMAPQGAFGTGVCVAPCTGSRCQLWDDDAKMCSFKVASYYLSEFLPAITVKLESISNRLPVVTDNATDTVADAGTDHAKATSDGGGEI